VVTGDWDDVYASALVSAPEIDAAILGRSREEGRTTIRLITISEKPGTLVAERLGPPSDRPQPIRLTVKVGYFGDLESERRLLAAVAERLRELAGVEWAPRRR
jgi:hypothetical protein